jgi:hypothetical protein
VGGLANSKVSPMAHNLNTQAAPSDSALRGSVSR